MLFRAIQVVLVRLDAPTLHLMDKTLLLWFVDFALPVPVPVLGALFFLNYKPFYAAN